MRTDVKIGIALGALVLIIAVAYYGSKEDSAIPIGNAATDVASENARVIDELFVQQDEEPAVGSPPGTAVSQPPGDSMSDVEKQTAQVHTTGIADESRSSPEHRPRPFASGTDALSAAPHSSASDSTTAPVPPPPRTQRYAAGSEESLQDAAQASGLSLTQGTVGPDQPGTESDSGQRIRSHTIARGDTFSSLAEEYYGSQRYARYLADVNPGVDPYHLKIGSRINIPPLPSRLTTTDMVAKSPGAHEYRVQHNDSLYRIADEVLGSGARWREIYHLNRDTIGPDPAHLRVGQILKLPATSGQAENG